MSKTLTLTLTLILLGCGTEETFTHPPHDFTLIEPSDHSDAVDYLVAFKNHTHQDTLQNPGAFLSQHRDIQEHRWEKYVDRGLATYSEFLALYHPTPPLQRNLKKRPWENLPRSLSFLQSQNPTPGVEINMMSFASPDRAQKVLHDLMNQGKIWYAELDGSSKLSQQQEPPPETTAVTCKTSLKKCAEDYKEAPHHIKATKVDLALDAFAKLPQGTQNKILSHPPVIAIMDSGVDISHPALKDRVVDLSPFKTKACGGAKHGCNVTRSEKKEFITKGVLGHKDFRPEGVKQDNDPCKQGTKCNHGMQVAGLAVGYKPDRGIYGTCPFCRYLPIRITQPGDSIRDSAIIRGLQYISLFYVKQELLVRVIVMSLGKFARSRSVEILIRSLKETGRGALTVAAAGNESVTHRSYPAAFSDVLSVANVDTNEEEIKPANTSNLGYSVDIAAPGEFLQVITTSGRHDGVSSGTSFAAPIVAGVAGLMLARFPQARAEELHHTLTETADRSMYNKNKKMRSYKVRTQDGTIALLLGKGMVDAERAVREIKNPDRTRFVRRVGGCGVIEVREDQSQKDSPTSTWIFWLFLLPALLLKAPSTGRRAQKTPSLTGIFEA